MDGTFFHATFFHATPPNDRLVAGADLSLRVYALFDPVRVRPGLSFERHSKAPTNPTDEIIYSPILVCEGSVCDGPGLIPVSDRCSFSANAQTRARYPMPRGVDSGKPTSAPNRSWVRWQSCF